VKGIIAHAASDDADCEGEVRLVQFADPDGG